MNTIAILREHIAETTAIADRYKSVLSEEPANIAYELSLTTIEKHIDDLQIQLKREKEIRDKEVVELRLKGKVAQYGSIPLSVLAGIAKNISEAITASSYYIKKGSNPKGRIPKEITDTLDLRLSGMAPGSTKLFLTGRISPDLYGNSLIEDSLENTFNLLNSESSEQLTESVSKVGVRSAKNINNLLKEINSSGLEAEISWASQFDRLFVWNGNKDNILKVINSLEKIKILESESIEYLGKLVTISLKARFEIEDETGVIYKGEFPTELLEDIKKLHIGDKVSGIIEKNTIINQVTDRKKNTYSLQTISPK